MISKQLEEAEAIHKLLKIVESTTGYSVEGNFEEFAKTQKKYDDKYHPKGNLFEKWDKFFKEYQDVENRYALGSLHIFEKAKYLNLLKDPNDKVIALDEAIELCRNSGPLTTPDLIDKFIVIRNKYLTPEEAVNVQ